MDQEAMDAAAERYRKPQAEDLLARYYAGTLEDVNVVRALDDLARSEGKKTAGELRDERSAS